MKSGMIRRIDELGRIVIPKEIRKNLKLNMGDIVEINMDEKNQIVLNKYSTLLGIEEDLFNISKVINENTMASILFIDDLKVIMSYGKKSEIYMDKEINANLYLQASESAFTKIETSYTIVDFLEERIAYIASISTSKENKGLMILLENEHELSTFDLISINNFRRFIIKTLSH